LTETENAVFVCAIVQVGHAVCGTLTPGHDPVQKVTLIPRGQARGLTWFIPGRSTAGQLHDHMSR
jgi:cell division protease FtsH